MVSLCVRCWFLGVEEDPCRGGPPYSMLVKRLGDGLGLLTGDFDKVALVRCLSGFGVSLIAWVRCVPQGTAAGGPF